MDKININQTLNRIVKLLYRVGIWREWEGCASRKWTIKGSYMFAYLLLEIFIAVCAFVSEDRDEFIFLSLLVVMVGVTEVKLFYILWKDSEILKFLYKTREQLQDMNEEHRKRIDFFLRFVNANIYMLIVLAVVYNMSCLPWLTTERKLPLFIRFTWEGRHSEIIYWICYVFLNTGILYCIISTLITFIIWYLMLCFAVGHEILGNKLRELGTQSKGTVQSASSTKRYLREFVRLVKIHRNFCEAVEQFRSCFSMMFLIQITTSGTSICVSTYNLAFSSSNNLFQTVTYVIVMLYAFFDIFLIMYFGNEMKIARGRLSYCLFESDWIKQSATDKKCVLILGEVLKKPQELLVFIYPVDLETFTMIIKGAYTLFNVLQNFA